MHSWITEERLSDPAAVAHQQATRVVVGLKARHEVRLKTHNHKRSTVVTSYKNA